MRPSITQLAGERFMMTEATEMVESAGEFRASGTRRGFSFVEILFAVMILGIGFILIAGIFPVAINQTQANGDETIAATTARQGAAIIASMPNTAALMQWGSPPTLHRFGPSGNTANLGPLGSSGDPDLALWNELNGAQVLSEDPRYAWVPFYYRPTDASGLAADWAQITIIAVRVRNHAAYVPTATAGGDLAVSGSGATATATLIGTPVTITSVSASTTLTVADTITFGSGVAAVAPGTFVVVATDPGAPTTGSLAGLSAVGWVLKVGQPVTPGGSVYYLQPGGDMKNSTLYKPAPSSGSPLNAFIVGQGADPDNPATFTGGAQDVMAYTTFIPLH